MARKPIPGSDGNNWGSVLNEYLDALTPSPGEVIVGSADGPVAVSLGSIGSQSGGVRVIGVGDSNCIGTQSFGTYEWATESWFNMAVLQSGGKLVWLRNAGVWGDTTAGVLARLDADVIVHKPDLVLLNIGTNDTTFGNYVHDTTTANYDQIVTRLRDAGIRVVCCTLLPRNDSTDARGRSARFNVWLWSYCVRHAVDFVDVTSPLVNPATGEFRAGMNNDALHLSSAGATLVGKTIMDRIGGLLPAATLPFARFKGDTTNLITNGVFAGDADSNGVADGWTFSLGAGGAATTALVSDPAIVGNWQELKITAGRPAITQYITASGKFAPGDVLRFSGRIQLEDIAGSTVGAYVAADFGGIDRLAPIRSSLASGTFDFTMARPVPVGSAGVNVNFYIGSLSTPATGTVRVAQLSLINETALGIS